MRAAIVGVAGYTGQELARLLSAHPGMTLAGLFGSAARGDEPIGAVAPSLRAVVPGSVGAGTVDAIVRSGAQVAFLAVPHEASLALAPGLLAAGVRVVDLSAAFRLKDATLYPAYYGFAHTEPALLAEAVYGLPEVFRRALPGARLIAAPGCYPTSVIVPVAPIIREGLVEHGRSVIVDATSGVSGAGRRADERTSFCEVSQSPYGVYTHRHGPEMEAYCNSPVIFTPHLGPYARGICSTIHAELRPGVGEDDVRAALDRAYRDEPFVRLLGPGAWPSVGSVERTNFIDIALAVRGTHAILVSCIDNLTKGAAGQAVQAFNASMRWAEGLGLHPVSGAEGPAGGSP
jgi:N-acetyl-gamma-glutamyl-phosphate reductase